MPIHEGVREAPAVPKQPEQSTPNRAWMRMTALAAVPPPSIPRSLPCGEPGSRRPRHGCAR
eukprot:7669578-Pyramimonas_sp.AAC.1